MKKIFLFAITAAFTFTACNKDNKAEATNEVTNATTTEVNTEHEDHDGHNHGTEAEITTTTASVNQVNNSVSTTTEKTTTSAQNVKINPPHGQPGHRCEIPVGAPLDGSATPAQPQGQVQAQPSNNGQGFLGSDNGKLKPEQLNKITPTQQAAPAQQTAPGMQGKPNPAHGQPGHRCDIQVGQPLP